MTDPAQDLPPSLPPPFDRVGDRPFSFYPPIVHIRHNEWLVKEATWSEVLVVNAKSAESIWIPRSFIGDLSRVDEPVMIVGLKRELEFKAGGVWPHTKRVLEMPRGGIAPPVPFTGEATAPPPGFSGASPSAAPNESRIGRLILISLLLGIGLCALVISYYRGLNSAESATYQGVMQTSLGLSSHDDVYAVRRKLGEPSSDRWVAEEGVLQFRLLDYPARRLKVVLMGRERDQATYIGAIDTQGRVVDSVDLPGGANTAATVRQAAKR